MVRVQGMTGPRTSIRRLQGQLFALTMAVRTPATYWSDADCAV